MGERTAEQKGQHPGVGLEFTDEVGDRVGVVLFHVRIVVAPAGPATEPVLS